MSRRFKRTTYMQWENKKRKHDMPYWISSYEYEWTNTIVYCNTPNHNLCPIINRKSGVYFHLDGEIFHFRK